MSRTGPYTRTRRAVMQAVMWVVLGATVAVAALVQRAHSRPVELNPPRIWGQLSVRVPRGWAEEPIRPRLLSGDPMGLMETEPVADDEPGRVVTYYQQPLLLAATPGQYLAGPRNVRAAQYNPMRVAGRPGVWAVEGTRIETPEGLMGATALWACTVTDSGYAVSIKLVVPGRYGRDDEKFLQQLANGITINDAPKAAE